MDSSASPSWVRRIWPLAAFQVAFIAGATQLKSVGNALVLARMDARVLPYLYLVGAIVVGVLAVVPRPVPGTPASAPARSAMVGAVLTALLGVGAMWQLSSIPITVYLLAEVGTTFVSLRLWLQAGARFDAREIRRAFPLLNAAAMGGGIVGGLLLQVVAERFGLPWTLAVAALLLGLSAWLWRFSLPLAPQPRRTGGTQRPRVRWRHLHRSAYIRLLGILVAALAILSTFADYLFRMRAGEALEEVALAALFGQLQVWLSVFCLLFQLLFAERLLERLGVLRYLALVPATLTPLLLWSLFSPGLWPVFTVRLVDNAISYTVLPVGMQLLYAAVPEARRDAARATMDGLIRKVGLGVAALTLIVAGTWATDVSVAVGGLILCALVGVALVGLWPEYLSSLGEQVGAVLAKEKRPPVQGDLRLLSAALEERAPKRALRAIELMASWHVDLRPQLPAILGHRHPDVVLRGIELALELQATEVAPHLERLITGGPPSSRDEAVWALSRLAPERAARLLPPLLDAPDLALALRCAVVGALLRTPDRARGILELDVLLQRREIAPVDERVEVARLLGLLRDARYTPMIVPYLDDPDLTVRKAALAAVGESGDATLAPRLLASLAVREERPVARAALVALGDAVTRAVARLLDDRGVPLSLRLHLPRVLRGIGTPLALEGLLFSNVRDDARLHYRIGAELLRLHEEHPEHPVDAERVHAAIERRARFFASLHPALQSLRASLGPRHLLTRAVQDRLDQTLELSFFLLGLLYPQDVMRRIHQHLGGEARQQALALELLENLVTEAQWKLLQEQLEPPIPRGNLGHPFTVAQHLRWLAGNQDLTLRTLARLEAKARGLRLAEEEDGDVMDLSTVEKMFLLQEVAAFAQSDVDDIAAVAAMARETVVAAGERLWSQGDPGESLCVIVEGHVDAFRHGEHVARFGPKQTLGEVNLLDGAARPTDMVPAEPVRLLVIDRRDFLDLLADRPELLAGLFRAISEQLQAFMDLPRRRESGEWLLLG